MTLLAQISVNEIRIKLLNEVLLSCEKEYIERADVFYKLDAKAQNTATINGILLAGCLTFFKKETIEAISDNIGILGGFYLLFIVLLLLTSIGFCLYASLIQTVLMPLQASELNNMTKDILDLDTFDSTNYEYYYSDRISAWEETLNNLADSNSKKALKVLWAQRFLSIAIIFVSIVLLYMLEISIK